MKGYMYAIVRMLCIVAVIHPHTSAGTLYRITGLGMLPGDTSSIAYGINDRGQVVGASRDAGGNNTLAGFLWDNGTMIDLGLYEGHSGIRPWDINNVGKISGRALNGPGGSNYGVYYNGSEWLRAGWVGGTRGNAFGINDSNAVVGNMRLPSNDFSRGFVWTPEGGTIELPTLHPDDPTNDVPSYNGYEGGSYAVGINTAGVVVGSSGLTDTHGTDRAFRWSRSEGMVDLGTPASHGLAGLEEYTQSYAQKINDAGVIVGAADRGPGLTRAVWWDTAGVLRDLGTFGGTSGVAYAVNNAGTIVGYSSLATGGDRAFVSYGGSSMIDLNTLLHRDSAGWTLLRAYDINKSGKIVGEGIFGGVRQGFIAAAVPEPSSLLLGVVGGTVGWVLFSRRRPNRSPRLRSQSQR